MIDTGAQVRGGTGTVVSVENDKGTLQSTRLSHSLGGQHGAYERDGVHRRRRCERRRIPVHSLRANGKHAQIFTSGQEFLAFTRHDSCACLILDLKMPGLNGLEVQKLIAAQTTVPIIFLTGRGDIPSTVTAMKGGAIDFLTKPVDEIALLSSIERAFELDREYRKTAHERAGLLARYQSLTPREKQVLPLLVRGLLNKQAAGELGITEYTVQIHRGHIMRKMGADSFATLVRLATRLNLEGQRTLTVDKNEPAGNHFPADRD